MIVIIGLGNIGREYENTVHNMGFKVVDRLADMFGVQFKKEKFKSVIAEARHSNEHILLVKPTTYMNRSGEAVALIKQKYKDARIIVAVDDIDLPRGTVRYRMHGSAGTHNGLRSIVSYIGTEFERVKIGVGRDESKDLADYVVSKLTAEEMNELSASIENGAKMILEQIN